MKKTEGDKDGSEDEGVPENNKRPNPESDAPPKQKRIKNLYRQPTAAELNQLHETENIFNSNLFRLQINEVLQEVKVKEKTVNKFQIWYEKLKQYLLSIPENNDEYDLSERTLQKELKVKIPIDKKLEDIKITFKFYKFNESSIVGSYKTECAINSKLCVDLAITMPAQTFTKNDSINYRYHKKMAYYLAIIASHLSKSEIIEDLKYSLQDNCQSKPILTFKPQGKLGDRLSVKLSLVCDESSFKLARLSPSRNNLRKCWFLNTQESEESNSLGPSTPFYNCSILQDLTHKANQSCLEEVLNNGENLRQAIVLMKIWLRQRNLKVSGHIISMLVSYLVQIRRINNIMSSYQIVRNVWIYISTSEWDKKSISLFKGSSTEIPSIEEFHSSFPVVFLDKTGFYNLCWRMSHGTYTALKRESTIAVQMLDNANINSFVPLFMTTQKFNLQFDEVLRFKDTPSASDVIYDRINEEDKLNYGLDKSHLIAKKIYDILKRGVGNRCNLILCSEKDEEFSWGINESCKKVKKQRNNELRFGFRLNSEEALNTIEKGPPANLPEAESFRAFWGDKSELRRFQDGAITETCVWDGETLCERRTVVRQIVKHLLKVKFGIEKDIFYICEQLESVLRCKQYRPTEFEYGTGEEAAVRLMQSFDSLRKDLRNLTDLPLHINSVYGTSPVFSYSDPLPPLPRPAPPPTHYWYREKCCLIKDGQNRDSGFKIHMPDFVKTSAAVIEFGHSGKWPGDIEAFRRLKAAFNVQIAENLTKQFSLTTHAYPTHIDVVKDGYVFRLTIAHQKEINLLRREIEKGVVKYRDTEKSVEMTRDLILLPRVRGALHGLHQKHPAFGPTVSIAKRWLSSHLLDGWHFPHLALELAAACAFVRPEPYAPPAQPTAGFVALLNLLAHTDWTTQPLIVNFNNELTRDEISDLEQKFTSERSSHPPLYIVTSHDVESPGIWSRDAPTDKVLARVQILAASALQYIDKALYETGLDNVMGIFKPSFVGYNAIIKLDTRYVPHHGEMVTEPAAQRPLPAGDPGQVVPVVEFNPVESYLAQLRSAYDEFCLFFHDAYGGDVIAVLWRPETLQEQDFQVLKSNGTKPKFSKEEAKCVVNCEAILEDFKILGDGLVKEIVLC